MVEIHKYILIKLNINSIKKEHVDAYIQTIISNIKKTNEFENVIVIQTIKAKTRIKIVYQIKNLYGQYIIKDVEL